MTSVERILTYNKLEQEAAPLGKSRPPDTWPESGSIELQDVSLYYYKGAPPALQNISLKIHSNEKVHDKLIEY